MHAFTHAQFSNYASCYGHAYVQHSLCACVLGPVSVTELYELTQILFAGSFLLQSKVKYENSYNIQEDTLIVWAEPDGSNLALSFQEKLGCVEIWESLTDVSPYCVRSPLTESLGRLTMYVSEAGV